MNNSSNHEFRQAFIQVVDELRSALGYSIRNEEPELGDEIAMEMMYGGFDFSVVHSLSKASDQLLVECMYGPIPEARAELITKRLLEMNAVLAELDGSVFGIDASGRKLVYTLIIDLRSLDGTTLLRKMTEIVWHGRRWLETRFLSTEAHGSRETLDPVQLA